MPVDCIPRATHLAARWRVGSGEECGYERAGEVYTTVAPDAKIEVPVEILSGRWL